MDSKIYLGTCWKVDLTPQNKTEDKHLQFWRAQVRIDGTVFGTCIDTICGVATARQVDACAPRPRLGMEQIDSTEFNDVLDKFLREF